MEFLLLIMALFGLGGIAIGVFWRWHLVWLLVLCGTLGFGICLAMRDWSDFNFSAIVANTRAGGSSWQSWVAGFIELFILYAVPSVVGGGVGFGLRHLRGHLCRH